MNVSLTPELESYVAEKVKSGGYASASEVVREALRTLQYEENSKRDWTAETRAHIQKGIADIEANRFRSFSTSAELLECVREEGRRQAGLLPDA